jgi:hypothetical protein
MSNNIKSLLKFENENAKNNDSDNSKFIENKIVHLHLNPKETYSLEEAAEYLKISIESVKYYSKRKGELSYISLSGKLVFRKSDLDKFLDMKVIQGVV